MTKTHGTYPFGFVPPYSAKSTSFFKGTPMVSAILARVYICGSTCPCSIRDIVALDKPPSKYTRSCEYPACVRIRFTCAPNFFRNCCFRFESLIASFSDRGRPVSLRIWREMKLKGFLLIRIGIHADMFRVSKLGINQR